MIIKLKTVCLVVICLLTISVPLFAHHGAASYDTDKKVTLKGAVTRWIWSNPHCLLQFDVTDDSGHVVRWVAETENPSTMIRSGWLEKSFKVGDQVTVTGLPVKNGNPVVRIIEVVLSSGQRLPGRINPDTEVKPDNSAKP